MRYEREPIALQARDAPSGEIAAKQDADYVFYELTRSICPIYRRSIDAQIMLRSEKVFMRKLVRHTTWVASEVYGATCARQH